MCANINSLPRGGSRRPSLTTSMTGYHTIASSSTQGNESQEALLPEARPQRSNKSGAERYSSLPKRTTKDGKINSWCPVPASHGSQLSEALSALDLESLDLSNIDPCLASDLLEEIRLGADLGPIIDKIRKSSKVKSSNIKETKVVTFQDETIKR